MTDVASTPQQTPPSSPQQTPYPNQTVLPAPADAKKYLSNLLSSSSAVGDEIEVLKIRTWNTGIGPLEAVIELSVKHANGTKSKYNIHSPSWGTISRSPTAFGNFLAKYVQGVCATAWNTNEDQWLTNAMLHLAAIQEEELTAKKFSQNARALVLDFISSHGAPAYDYEQFIKQKDWGWYETAPNTQLDESEQPYVMVPDSTLTSWMQGQKVFEKMRWGDVSRESDIEAFLNYLGIDPARDIRSMLDLEGNETRRGIIWRMPTLPQLNTIEMV